MKSLRLALLLAMVWPAADSLAQNWSTPIPVTSGAGEDHRISVGYLNYQGPLLLAWDRTVNGSTEIYARTFDPETGHLGDELPVSNFGAISEKPAVMEFVECGNGVFFQSNRNGLFSIWFAQYSDSGFTVPWETLHSTSNLTDPIVRPFSDVATPSLICHADSSPVYWMYDYLGVPQDCSFYLPDTGSYHVGEVTGRWTGTPVLPQYLWWAWEAQVSGQWEIQYSYTWPGWPQIEYDGFIPNDGYDYHHPVQGYNLNLYFDRETPQGTDIVSTAFDPNSGIWSLPIPPFQGDTRNPHYGNVGNIIFEAHWNNNWDIVYWHPNGGMDPEIIDTDSADDLNPILYFYGDGRLHAFWESNRDGNWRIYTSYGYTVGVTEPPGQAIPQTIQISVSPNPANAQFRIELNLPAAGMTKVGVWDLAGRKVGELCEGSLPAGNHALTWDAAAQASGIYVLKVEYNDHIQSQKLVLLK